MRASDFFYASRGNPHAFAGNHFRGTGQAGMFVDDLKRDGATVVVAGILDDEQRVRDEGGPYADTLYVDLRGSPNAPAVLQRIRDEGPDELDEVSPGVWRVWWD